MSGISDQSIMDTSTVGLIKNNESVYSMKTIVPHAGGKGKNNPEVMEYY